jgi:uncharacterized protein with beta-barrel porin domain
LGGSILELAGVSDVASGTTVSDVGSRLHVTGTLGGGVFVNSGATVSGTGTINGPVNLSGTLAPGASPGDLTVNGLVTFNFGSTFALELNGAAAGTGHDQLTVGAEGAR